VLYSTVRLRQFIGYSHIEIARDSNTRFHAPIESLVGSADQKTAPARALFSGPSHPVPFRDWPPARFPQHTPWKSPDAKTSSRRFRPHETARQPFRRCVLPMPPKAVASMRSPEGVSTT
jgi:hypothetical protein